MSSSIVPKAVVAEMEVTINSAVNLQHPHPSLSSNSYVSVGLVSPDTPKPKFYKTNTHENGGNNPEYGYMVVFPLSQEQLRMATNYHLVCKIKHQGTLWADRKIGKVTVSLQKLIETKQGQKIHYPVVIDGNVERGKLVISHKLVRNGGDDGDGDILTNSPPTMGGNQDPNSTTTSSAIPPTAVDGVRVTAGVTSISTDIYEVLNV